MPPLPIQIHPGVLPGAEPEPQGLAFFRQTHQRHRDFTGLCLDDRRAGAGIGTASRIDTG